MAISGIRGEQPIFELTPLPVSVSVNPEPAAEGGFSKALRGLAREIATLADLFHTDVPAVETMHRHEAPILGLVGSLSAVNGVDVATQVAGIVSAIPISSGATVDPNAVLLQLNIDPDKAQLASLHAAAEVSALTLKRDTNLVARQAVSQSTVDADAAETHNNGPVVASLLGDFFAVADLVAIAFYGELNEYLRDWATGRDGVTVNRPL